jgi:hypothetical protein
MQWKLKDFQDENLVTTGRWVYSLSQPVHITRPVSGVDSSAMSKFSVQHDSGFVTGHADKDPVACLINLSKVTLIQIRIAHEQPNSRHLPFE